MAFKARKLRDSIMEGQDSFIMRELEDAEVGFIEDCEDAVASFLVSHLSSHTSHTVIHVLVHSLRTQAHYHICTYPYKYPSLSMNAHSCYITTNM